MATNNIRLFWSTVIPPPTVHTRIIMYLSYRAQRAYRPRDLRRRPILASTVLSQFWPLKWFSCAFLFSIVDFLGMSEQSSKVPVHTGAVLCLVRRRVSHTDRPLHLPPEREKILKRSGGKSDWLSTTAQVAPVSVPAARKAGFAINKKNGSPRSKKGSPQKPQEKLQKP